MTGRIPPLLVGLSLSTSAAGQGAPPPRVETRGDLVVVILNVHSDEGKIRCALYPSANGFPDEHERAVRGVVVRARMGAVRCLFRGLTNGEDYAVAVIHDEDDDRELDTNLFGVPSEGYGVSNNAEAEPFGPPTYENARFVFRGGRMRLRVRLRY